MGKLVELAEDLLGRVKQYEAFFETQGSPVPGLDSTSFPGTAKQHELEGSDEVARMRGRILSTSSQISAVASGGVQLAVSNIVDPGHHAALQMLYRHSIPAHVPLDGSYITYEDLSRRCRLNLPDLKRVLRYAMSCYLFTERDGTHVAHTAASKAFACIPPLQEWSGMICEELWPATVKLADAVAKWPYSNEANQAGFQIAHQTNEPIFMSVSKDHDRISRFQKSMAFVGSLPVCSSDLLIPIYSWSTKKLTDQSSDKTSSSAIKLVDVGGSHGNTSFALASATPNLECIVQDLPDTVAAASSHVPSNLSSRVTFMAHDFFTPQPVIGADIYLLRWILHDWSDAKAIDILRALVPALKPGARVLVNEWMVPLSSDEKGANTDRYHEKIVRSFDLLMWSMSNGKERDEEELKALFKEADHRFEWIGWVPAGPTGAMGLGEALWRGD